LQHGGASGGLRHALLHDIVAGGGEADGVGGAGAAVGAGEGGFAADRGAVRHCLPVGIGLQVDGGDPGLRQRLQRCGAVGIGDHDAEAGPTGVGGVERAVVVGVEDVFQRLHVGLGGRVPQGEVDLVGLGYGAAAGIVNQHAVAGAGPGGVLLVAVVGEVEEHVRRG